MPKLNSFANTANERAHIIGQALHSPGIASGFRDRNPMESVALIPRQRRDIISQIITTVQAKFYDPKLHGVDIIQTFDVRMRDIMECPASSFAQEVEKTLTVLR